MQRTDCMGLTYPAREGKEGLFLQVDVADTELQLLNCQIAALCLY